jgi:metal-dependent hydrolase (beta-lactamase superfamily II)
LKQAADEDRFTILSHIHEDHVCGLEAVLDQCHVGEIRMPMILRFYLSNISGSNSSRAQGTPIAADLMPQYGILNLQSGMAIPVDLLQLGICLTMRQHNA